jgi:hypothetical protein
VSLNRSRSFALTLSSFFVGSLASFGLVIALTQPSTPITLRFAVRFAPLTFVFFRLFFAAMVVTSSSFSLELQSYLGIGITPGIPIPGEPSDWNGLFGGGTPSPLLSGMFPGSGTNGSRPLSGLYC